jgi:uncharacterized membrane protein
MKLLLSVGYNTNYVHVLTKSKRNVVNLINWFNSFVDIWVSFVAGECDITLLRPWHQTSASQHPVRKINCDPVLKETSRVDMVSCLSIGNVRKLWHCILSNWDVHSKSKFLLLACVVFSPEVGNVAVKVKLSLCLTN